MSENVTFNSLIGASSQFIAFELTRDEKAMRFVEQLSAPDMGGRVNSQYHLVSEHK